VCNAGFKCDVIQVVHAEVTLQMTVSDFYAVQTAYINAVAAAAGVNPSQVVIVAVTSAITPGRRRRLLSSEMNAQVHTSIYNSNHNAAPHRALETLNVNLLKQGLKEHLGVKVSLHKEVRSSMKAT
jgi:hypothetical protein